MARNLAGTFLRLSKKVAYLALSVFVIGLLLSLIGSLTNCHRDDGSEYPTYCALAGVGMFILFTYYVILLPALLAVVGAVFFVMDMVRIGLHIAARRRGGIRSKRAD